LILGGATAAARFLIQWWTRSAVNPYRSVGVLAAIVAIRTCLSFSLGVEIEG
jgi:hypothetical protein